MATRKSLTDARWWVCAAACNLVFGGAAAIAAHVDPAPLPDDVIERLTAAIQGPDNPAVGLAAAGLAAVIDTVDALQASSIANNGSGWQVEDRNAIQSQRNQLGRIQTELLQSSPSELFAETLRVRFDQLDGLLNAIGEAATPDSRTAAINSLRNLLASWSTLASEPDELAPTSPAIRPAPRFTPFEERPGTAPAYTLNVLDAPVLLASIGEVAVVAPTTPTEASSCNYDPVLDLSSVQEEVNYIKYPKIKALAEQLGYSPTRLFEYVSQNVKFEPYYGSLKGAAGTLEAMGGNAHDQASLLIALLRAANVPTRYVLGDIDVRDPAPSTQDSRIARWLGVKSYAAAESVLTWGHLFKEKILEGTPAAAVGVRLHHVWVEACLPYSSYRGSRITNQGHRWIPLDPSFKDNTYQAGIVHAATFDLPAFLTRRTNGPDSLPHEVYAKNVAAAIRLQPPAYSNNSLNEVPYIGKIEKRRYDILPASLPYRVAQFSAWDSTAQGSSETATLPDSHRVTLTVRVTTPANSVTLLQTLRMPAIVMGRVTLSFKGATAADQTAIDNWRNNATLYSAEPAATVQVKPVLKVEGADWVTGTVAMPFNATSAKLDLELGVGAACGTTPGCLNRVSFASIQGGNYYSLQIYASQISKAQIAERAAKLIQNVRSTSAPNGSVLQDGIEGEFLHVVGLKYMSYVSAAATTVAQQMGAYCWIGNHLGIVGARSKIGYVFDLPFAVNRKGFLIDFPGLQFSPFSLESGMLNYTAFFMAARGSSAYESYVWQENAKLDAVSTIRGLQFANETGVGLINATPANWATEKLKLTGYSTADMMSFNTFVMTHQANLIAPKTKITYNDWQGVVFMAESTLQGYGIYAISGGYKGGYTVNNPVSANYNSVLDTGYSFVAPPPAVTYTPVINNAPPPPAVVNSAVNFGGSASNTYSGDPVNMVTGNFYHNETDIDIPVGGTMRMVLQRAYNSRKPQDGPLGFGWTHSFNQYIEFRDDNYNEVKDAADTDGITSSVVWVDGTGAERYMSVAGTPTGVPINTSFYPPAGLFHYGSRSNGVPAEYRIYDGDGMNYAFESVAGTNGQRAKLIAIRNGSFDALYLFYDAGGKLASIRDDLDRSIVISYVPGTSRIRDVSDWGGRKWQYEYDALGNLVKYWKAGVARTDTPSMTYQYYSATDGTNLNHLLKRYQLARGNGMDIEYYANARVFRHRNSAGNAVSFSYNDFRRETTQINELGLERRFFFNKDGLPIRLVEENGGTQEYSYGTGSDRFNVLQSVDQRGNETKFAYDTNGSRIRTTMPSGATEERSLFTTGRNLPGKIKDALGNVTLIQYYTFARGSVQNRIVLKQGRGGSINDPNYVPPPSDISSWTANTYIWPSSPRHYANLATSRQVRDFSAHIANPTTASGPTVEYTYDSQNLFPVSVSRKGDTDGSGSVDIQDQVFTSPLVYDTYGRLLQGVDDNWEPITREYYDDNRVKSVLDSAGNKRSFFYDGNGNLVREMLTGLASGNPALLETVEHQYDAVDRRIKSITSGGQITAVEYDAAGNAVRTTDADGYSATVEYDELNRPIAMSDADGNRVVKHLDVDGRVLSVVDANGLRTTYDYYDSSKDLRLKRVTQPVVGASSVGRSTEFDYDAVGNVIRISEFPADATAPRVTLKAYDELNRVTQVIGPVLNDSILGQIRPITRLSYDSLGRVIQVESGRTDSVGNVQSTAVQAAYKFDDFGRMLLKKARPNDGTPYFWTYRYDISGNMVSATDPNGNVTEQTFDPGRRLRTRTSKTLGSTVFNTVTYTRNSLGQPLAVTNTNPAYTQTFGYDAANRLSFVEDSRGSKRLSYDYSPGGRLDAMRHSDGSETNYLYDPIGRLTGIWAPNYDYFAFGYDKGGRLTEKWAPNGVRSDYTYNGDDSIAAIRHSAGGAERAAHLYVYDAWGSRQEHRETLWGEEARYLHDYDELGRLTRARRVQGGVESLIGQYRYDVNGNRTRLTDATGAYLNYQVNERNEVEKADLFDASGALTGTQVVQTYDFAGNLLSKTGTGFAQNFTWNANNELAAVVTQTTSGGVTTTNTEQYWYDHLGRRTVRMVNGGQVLSQYLYNGADIYEEYGATFLQPLSRFTHGPATDDPLLAENANGRFYYHADARGSVSLMTDTAGTSGAWRRYDPWGRVLGTAGTLPQYGFTGREPDLTTGLMYYRARYYDPALGRFTGVDPLGPAGGINAYAYADNDPVSNTDPVSSLGINRPVRFRHKQASRQGSFSA